MRIGVGLAAAALMLVGACGEGSEKAENAEPEAKGFDVSGTVTLTSSRGVEAYSDTCRGTNGYDDIQEGAGVVVYNADGKKIGLGRLDAGEPGAYANVQCSFDFTVSDVPESGSIYSVEVASRGEVSFDRDQADDVELSLG
jgi:hypothetical protein